MKFLTELKNNKKGYFFGNINEKTVNNSNYRKVIFTSENMQLVAMSLKEGEEIGMETHKSGAQFIRIEQGQAEFVINGKTHKAKDGDSIVIPQGAEHNVINTGSDELKLYAIYAPPEHPDGTVQKNKPED